MWRYGIGSEPPTKKKKSTSECNKDFNDKKYDTEQRIRKFQDHWPKIFPWLEYETEKNKMFCRLCRNAKDADKESAFVTGSSNFKLDSVKAHANSTQHVKVFNMLEKSKEAPGTSQASKALLSLQKCQKDRLTYLFRTAHAVAKHSRPFTDFVWQCKLDKMKNIDIGESYQNDKACREFIKYIAEACFAQLFRDMQEVKCFSLMCDESTDSAIIEQLLIYVVFCTKGEIYTKFLKIVSLQKADSESIFLALRNICSDLFRTAEKPFEKLLCFVADGARTMQGCRIGVKQRILEEQSHVIGLHCMAHRLELAFKNTVKQFKIYRDVEDLLLKVYKFYHNSPLNRAELKEACASLGIRQLVPTRVGGTRWLPHIHTALNNFLEIYNGLKLQMENCSQTSKTDSAAVSLGLLKSLTTPSLICAALELNEVVCCLQKVSLTLQNRNTTLFHAYRCMEAVQESLASLKENTEKIKNKINDFEFPDEKKKRNENATETNSYFQQFVNSIIEQLQERFVDIDESLLSVSKILSLSEWPLKPCPKNFGEPEFSAVLENYGTILKKFGIQTSEVLLEWKTLKNALYSRNEEPNTLTWKDINVQHHLGHSQILAVIDILLTIPSTSVECERGFRNMNEIKTDWRSTLSAESLNDLMRIYLDTPDIEYFDPLPAITLWLEGGERKRKIEHESVAD